MGRNRRWGWVWAHRWAERRGRSPGWRRSGSGAAWTGEELARLNNIPFFVRGVAAGDVVPVTEDEEGVLWAGEPVEYSGNCTIRIIPAEGGHRTEVRQAVLDAFAPLGVEGEGIGRFGLVALHVPAEADVSAVKRLVVTGATAGRWHYEEGCVTARWQTAGPPG